MLRYTSVTVAIKLIKPGHWSLQEAFSPLLLTFLIFYSLPLSLLWWKELEHFYKCKTGHYFYSFQHFFKNYYNHRTTVVQVRRGLILFGVHLLGGRGEYWKWLQGTLQGDYRVNCLVCQLKFLMLYPRTFLLVTNRYLGGKKSGRWKLFLNSTSLWTNKIFARVYCVLQDTSGVLVERDRESGASITSWRNK